MDQNLKLALFGGITILVCVMLNLVAASQILKWVTFVGVWVGMIIGFYGLGAWALTA